MNSWELHQNELKILAERIYRFRMSYGIDGEEETDWALAQEYFCLAELESGYDFDIFCENMFSDEINDARRRQDGMSILSID